MGADPEPSINHYARPKITGKQMRGDPNEKHSSLLSFFQN
jgi:hypothetical protein